MNPIRARSAQKIAFLRKVNRTFSTLHLFVLRLRYISALNKLLLPLPKYSIFGTSNANLNRHTVITGGAIDPLWLRHCLSPCLRCPLSPLLFSLLPFLLFSSPFPFFIFLGQTQGGCFTPKTPPLRTRLTLNVSIIPHSFVGDILNNVMLESQCLSDGRICDFV